MPYYCSKKYKLLTLGGEWGLGGDGFLKIHFNRLT